MAFVESPLPRDVFTYEGGDAVESAWLEAHDRGRLHHAWLLTGPEGVGKATFAFRAARRLLGARPDQQFGLLGSSPDSPVSRQIMARSHPDLLVLERRTEDGKPRKFIPVDEARKLGEFFSKAPASSPFRIAIIDSVDDMNPSAANAILKTLEEPPPHGVLFLISHAPGGLLPTIRSRCRRLVFAPWPDDRVAAFVEARTGAPAAQAERLARMAKGAPGRAMTLAANGAIEMDRAAHDLLSGLPATDDAALQALADTFRGAEGQGRFELLFDRLADQIHAMAIEGAGQSPGLDRWAEVWKSLISLPREAEALNLDRADAFFSTVARLRQAARA